MGALCKEANMRRTAEGTTTATIEITVVADAAPVAGLIPLQTERLNLRRKARRQGTRVISRNGTTTMKDHAGAGATTAGHPPGRDVGGPVLLHGITNQVISPRRKEKSRERSRMIRRRDDPVVDDVPDTGAGLMRNALKAMNKKNEMVIMKEEKTEKSVRHRIVAVVVLTADLTGALVERTERGERKTANPSPRMKRL